MDRKYKILIAGQTGGDMADYFDELCAGFKCVGTSEVPSEVKSDLNVFRPDAFLCFYRESDDSMAGLLQNLQVSALYGSLAYIIVGTPAGCDEFAKKAPSFPALMIRTPMPALDMRLQIGRYLDKTCRALTGDAVSTAGTRLPADAAMRKSLLIVDDDELTLELLQSVLELDYLVTCATGAAMARECLKEKAFDLILLDYVMPEESGAEFFRRLKADPGTSSIPVVFLTGIEDGSQIREILALNPQGYLMKPIDTSRLRDAVMCALE